MFNLNSIRNFNGLVTREKLKQNLVDNGDDGHGHEGKRRREKCFSKLMINPRLLDN